MGAMVALLYAVRHPNGPSGLVLIGGMARYDVGRITEGFRRVAGDEVAEIARREYGGDSVADDAWARVRIAFGPHILSEDERSRLAGDAELGEIGMRELARFDVVGELGGIDCPVLVIVGEVDPVTPVPAAREIAGALRPGTSQLEIVAGAGHWPWLDDGDRIRELLTKFVLGGRAPDSGR